MGKDKGKGYLRVVGKEDRLTAKQEAFAMQVAKGAVLSDAYRECYSAEGMRDSTIWSEACKLAQNPKVATRVKALQAETDGARVRALELLGKTVSMFTDKIEQTDTAERSASDIEADLRRRLDRLLG